MNNPEGPSTSGTEDTSSFRRSLLPGGDNSKRRKEGCGTLTLEMLFVIKLEPW